MCCKYVAMKVFSKNLTIITSGFNQTHSQTMNTVGAVASIAGVYPEISLGWTEFEAIYNLCLIQKTML
jgi:hypothetical protein